MKAVSAIVALDYFPEGYRLPVRKPIKTTQIPN